MFWLGNKKYRTIPPSEMEKQNIIMINVQTMWYFLLHKHGLKNKNSRKNEQDLYKFVSIGRGGTQYVQLDSCRLAKLGESPRGQFY